ncbi:hypothetical protein BXO87_02420 [Bacillus sp. GZB]|nr:hypothetical protein BXO87_02420 [Bacillus sp. GZB]
MKNFLKNYSTSDLVTLIILMAGIVAIDAGAVSPIGKIARVLLYTAVFATILKGFILAWRERKNDRG